MSGDPTSRALDALAAAGRLQDGDDVRDLIEVYGAETVQAAERWLRRLRRAL